MYTRIAIVFICSLLAFFNGLAKEVPPPSTSLVNDYAGILDAGQRAALEQKLVAYDDSTSTQIAVVIDQSLEGDDVFEYSFRIAETWGIGTKGKDNGILIYIALDERKLYIHAGMGVQDYLTDNMSKRLIEQILKPAFRQGAYYEGLDQVTSAIIDLSAGRFVNEEGRGKKEKMPSWIIIAIIIAVFLFFRSAGNSGGGGFHGGGRYGQGGGWFIFPGGFGGGGGGGWSDGGGDFGGFDGGGFDGGGAGGDW